MRGSDKLKATLSINNETKSILVKALIIYNFITLFVYWNKKRTLLAFAVLSIFEVIATFFIFKVTKPKIVKENGVEKLESVVSVNSAGTVSFCWDVMIWGMVGKFLVSFSFWWAVALLGIPISFVFEFVIKPYKKLKVQ